MEFDFSAYDDFRREIEDYCKAKWPPDGFAPFMRPAESQDAMWQEMNISQKELGDRGWLCGAWPVEYGGGGWPRMKQAVFNETAAYHGIRGAGGLGISTIGPTLMIYGTEEQKSHFLPKIARGEINWSQGFSEPNAGSDLASLQTRAVADGDDFVINGAKIWNHSTHAHYIFLLARTNPDVRKHAGITQFIVPRNSPGITIEPILNTNRLPGWTLLTLEDVRVPRSAVVGEVDRGWYQSTTALDFERSQIRWVGEARRMLRRLVQFASAKKREGKPIIEDPYIRDQIGAISIDIEASRWLSYRIAFMQDQGLMPNAEASMSKLFATETLQRLQRLGVNLIGPLGLLSAGSEWAELEGIFEREYWAAPGQTFAGGASEIQRNIIATRGLGLPR